MERYEFDDYRNRSEHQRKVPPNISQCPGITPKFHLASVAAPIPKKEEPGYEERHNSPAEWSIEQPPEEIRPKALRFVARTFWS
jgi:hypothetical protein